MTELPSIGKQIECLQWLELHVEEMGKRAHLRRNEIEEHRRRLEAAIETLGHLEFGREIAR